jgi:hypothetical protein
MMKQLIADSVAERRKEKEDGNGGLNEQLIEKK